MPEQYSAGKHADRADGSIGAALKRYRDNGIPEFPRRLDAGGQWPDLNKLLREADRWTRPADGPPAGRKLGALLMEVGAAPAQSAGSAQDATLRDLAQAVVDLWRSEQALPQLDDCIRELQDRIPSDASDPRRCRLQRLQAAKNLASELMLAPPSESGASKTTIAARASAFKEHMSDVLRRIKSVLDGAVILQRIDHVLQDRGEAANRLREMLGMMEATLRRSQNFVSEKKDNALQQAAVDVAAHFDCMAPERLLELPTTEAFAEAMKPLLPPRPPVGGKRIPAAATPASSLRNQLDQVTRQLLDSGHGRGGLGQALTTLVGLMQNQLAPRGRSGPQTLLKEHQPSLLLRAADQFLVAAKNTEVLRNLHRKLELQVGRTDASHPIAAGLEGFGKALRSIDDALKTQPGLRDDDGLGVVPDLVARVATFDEQVLAAVHLAHGVKLMLENETASRARLREAHRSMPMIRLDAPSFDDLEAPEFMQPEDREDRTRPDPGPLRER